MTQEITMATIPQAVEAYRELHSQAAGTFDPKKSAVLSTIAAQENPDNWRCTNLKLDSYVNVIKHNLLKINYFLLDGIIVEKLNLS